jgi:hypothetical protein
MESDEEVAQRWRLRAEELRAMASAIGHPTAAAELKALATKWDVMVKEAEERAERRSRASV